MTENTVPHGQKVLQENSAFEAGDIVRLKSGGPSMTLRSIDGDKIRCRWFDKNSLRESTFLKVELVLTTPEQELIVNISPDDAKVL